MGPWTGRRFQEGMCGGKAAGWPGRVLPGRADGGRGDLRAGVRGGRPRHGSGPGRPDQLLRHYPGAQLRLQASRPPTRSAPDVNWEHLHRDPRHPGVRRPPGDQPPTRRPAAHRDRGRAPLSDHRGPDQRRPEGLCGCQRAAGAPRPPAEPGGGQGHHGRAHQGPAHRRPFRSRRRRATSGRRTPRSPTALPTPARGRPGCGAGRATTGPALFGFLDDQGARSPIRRPWPAWTSACR
jgi:hypothetical protein